MCQEHRRQRVEEEDRVGVACGARGVHTQRLLPKTVGIFLFFIFFITEHAQVTPGLPMLQRFSRDIRHVFPIFKKS